MKAVLQAQPDFDVVAEAADGVAAVGAALDQDLDLAVLDVSMPRMTGIQAAAEILRYRPAMKVLILTMHESEQLFYDALQAGAAGYVVKSAAGHDLVEAARAALRGELFLNSDLLRGLAETYLDALRRGDERPPHALTARELERTLDRAFATVEDDRERGGLHTGDPRVDGVDDLRVQERAGRDRRAAIDEPDARLAEHVAARGWCRKARADRIQCGCREGQQPGVRVVAGVIVNNPWPALSRVPTGASGKSGPARQTPSSAIHSNAGPVSTVTSCCSQRLNHARAARAT